jgi:hypothetical protein
MLVKIVGPSPLMSFASRSMIARDADTNGAISICWTVNPNICRQSGETHFVDHEEVGMCDTRSPLTRNLISALGSNGISQAQGIVNGGHHRDIDHVDDKICQLAGIVCSEIVTSALDEK